MSGCAAAGSNIRISSVSTSGAVAGTATTCNSGYALSSATAC